MRQDGENESLLSPLEVVRERTVLVNLSVGIVAQYHTFTRAPVREKPGVVMVADINVVVENLETVLLNFT
jgi:hypothetical protein